MRDAVAAAEAGLRYNLRPLLPEAPLALADAVERIAGPTARSLVARSGAVEALAAEGLSAAESRVLERAAQAAGVRLVTDRDGGRAVLMGPVEALAGVGARLLEWGQATEALGLAMGATLTGRHGDTEVRCGGRSLHLGGRTLLMGVVNATPDSFSGDGLGADPGAALELAGRMVAEGADVIDVGGESTRPGSSPVDAATERARVIPVVERLAERLPVPVSIDTRKAEVAEAGIAAGATLVNDIWGLRGDPAMAGVLAAHPEVALVAMHNRRVAGTGDLMAEVARGLRESLLLAARHGVAADRVILDPGFGFGKTPAENLELMRRLGELRGIGRPLLLGASRKSTIGLLLDGAPPELRMEGTLALCVLGAAAGVEMMRVHDVAGVRRGLTVADAVIRGAPEAVRAAPSPGPTG